jgi:hypothetical protein
MIKRNPPLVDKFKIVNYLTAIFLMFMGTVGSGIFVLPYLFYHSNQIFASFFLLILGAITLVLNLFYSKIVSSTSGDHQLAGYARLYLGPRFSLLASINLTLLSCGAIIAYSKLFSSFFITLLPVTISSTQIIYLALLSLFFFFKFQLSSRLSFIIPVFMLLIPISIFIFSFLFIGHTSYFINQVPNFSFFGATIFALSGFTIIPEIQEILLKGRQKLSLPLAVTLGTLLVIFIYLSFIFGVIRLAGSGVSIDTVTGIAGSFPALAKVISAFGLVVVLRASYGFLIILRELFYRDLKFSYFNSSVLSFSFCLLTLFFSSVSLISVISITGHITIFISALLICLIRLRLPHSFSTLFFTILIILSLFFGLIIALS